MKGMSAIMKKYANTLKDVALFKNMNENDILDFFKNIPYIKKTYEKDETVLHSGEKTRSIGIVLSGTVHVVYSDFWGNSNIIAEIGEKDIFAEAYAVAGRPPDISAIAAADSEIVFADIFKAPPERLYPIYANFTQILASKNIRLNQKLRHISQRTTREKLISYLSSEAIKAGGESFEIPFNRQQLADYLSVERSAMSAELSKMRKDGIIDFCKNKFCLKKNNFE